MEIDVVMNDKRYQTTGNRGPWHVGDPSWQVHRSESPPKRVRGPKSESRDVNMSAFAFSTRNPFRKGGGISTEGVAGSRGTSANRLTVLCSTGCRVGTLGRRRRVSMTMPCRLREPVGGVIVDRYGPKADLPRSVMGTKPQRLEITPVHERLDKALVIDHLANRQIADDSELVVETGQGRTWPETRVAFRFPKLLVWPSNWLAPKGGLRVTDISNRPTRLRWGSSSPTPERRGSPTWPCTATRSSPRRSGTRRRWTFCDAAATSCLPHAAADDRSGSVSFDLTAGFVRDLLSAPQSSDHLLRILDRHDRHGASAVCGHHVYVEIG